MKNIYEKALQCMKPDEIDHHETDLYLLVNETSKALVNEYDYKNLVTVFISNIEPRVPWYEIPFAYSPGWKKENRWPYNSPLPKVLENGGKEQ